MLDKILEIVNLIVVGALGGIKNGKVLGKSKVSRRYSG